MEGSHQLSTDEIFIRSISDAVLDNLSNEQFGVEELSKIVGFSRSQIHRKLQKTVGKSITQFIREIRLEEANKLLIKDTGTAAEISYQVGFNSPTYFNSCFHEYFGYPPGEIKKRKLEGHGDQTLDSEKEEIIPIHKETSELSGPDRSTEVYTAKLSAIHTTSPGKKRKSWMILWSIIIMAVLAVFITILLSQTVFKNKRNLLGRNGDKSIAVLPFNYDPGSTKKHFADGVVADIHYNLSMMGNLRVIARTSMERFRETTLSAKEIAKELSVDYLLEGNVQKYDNAVKIHISLIHGKSEEIIWTNVYQQDLDNYFEIQNMIASQVAEELYVNITPEENQRISKIPTNDPTAYDYYIQAKEAHIKHWLFPDTMALASAIHYYRQALNYDSTYANAWAGLSLAYYDKIGTINLDDQESPFWDSLLIFSEKAIQFDDQLGEAYLVRSIYEYGMNGNVNKAIELIDLALEYDPNNTRVFEQKAVLLWRVQAKHKEAIINTVEACKRKSRIELAQLYEYLARVYTEMGFYELSKKYIYDSYILRKNESKSYTQEKVEISYYNNLAFLEFGVGNYAGSIKLFEKAQEIDTTLFISPVFLIVAGQYDKAYHQSLKYLKITNGDPWIADIHRIGFSFLQMGFQEEALYYFDLHLAKTQKSIEGKSFYAIRKYAYYDLAATHSMLGNTEDAFTALEKLKNSHSYPLYVLNLLKSDDPMFDGIRNDPRFFEIVDHIEERYLKERKSVEDWLIEQGSFDPV